MAWENIESAPRDGSDVIAGKRPWWDRETGWPIYPITSRFIDGKWQANLGDRWAPYDPQPDVWLPPNPR